MKFLETRRLIQLLLTWGSVSVLWLSQDPEVWVLSLVGPRVLHETKEVAAGAPGRAANTENTCVPPASMQTWDPATV